VNKFFATLILSLVVHSLFSQINEGEVFHSEGDIHMEKTFWGVKFYEDARLLKPKQVLKIMESNPEAYAEFKKAKSNYDASQVFGFIGGFMICWPLGTALAGGEPEWGIAAGGLAVLCIAIPLDNAFKKHARNAITTYNSTSVTARRPVFRVHLNGAGARVVMKF